MSFRSFRSTYLFECSRTLVECYSCFGVEQWVQSNKAILEGERGFGVSPTSLSSLQESSGEILELSEGISGYHDAFGSLPRVRISYAVKKRHSLITKPAWTLIVMMISSVSMARILSAERVA
ncbi:uncharacterized protein LOC143856474 isoform X2 [Tasmannia lanceolata]|uniref:uncharacterized protein LOC143856474 isoform X2 n=1 Tax=Tasmannia lanceolata TaxID=3420 RepID=UPI004063B71E